MKSSIPFFGLLIVACGSNHTPLPTKSTLQNTVFPDDVPAAIQSFGIESSETASSLAASSSAALPFSPSYSYGSLTDSRDGQTYKTTVIGTQTWMAQNLNYTPATGNSWCYNNQDGSCATYGRLYDYATALTACPAEWHLPSDSEWQALESFIYSSRTFLATAPGLTLTGFRGVEGSALMASAMGGSDGFGFSAIPGGRYYEGSFLSVGSEGYWWTASSYTYVGSQAWYRMLNHSKTSIFRDVYYQNFGFSVRCMQTTSSIPSSSGASSSSLASSSSSVSPSSSSRAPSSSSLPSSSVSPSSSASNWNTAISYGNLLDSRDDQTYRTVLLGTQTWMAQNLSYKPTVAPDSSWCYMNDTLKCTYGRLYDFPTALTVCPNGWHLPTDAEWKTMEIFAGMSEATANAIGWRGGMVGAQLKANSALWAKNTGSDDYGFSALPGGSYGGVTYAGGTFSQATFDGYWWTATTNGAAAWNRWLDFDNTNVSRGVSAQSMGISVRCLQDAL